MNEKFVVLVGVIPVFNGKVLITQRSLKLKFLPGAWGLPCGKVEFDENLEDAVKRELMEETGLDGDLKQLVGYSKFTGNKDGIKLYNLQINYLVELYNDEVILDESSEAYKWLDISKLDEASLDIFTLNAIRQAFPIK